MISDGFFYENNLLYSFDPLHTCDCLPLTHEQRVLFQDSCRACFRALHRKSSVWIYSARPIWIDHGRAPR